MIRLLILALLLPGTAAAECLVITGSKALLPAGPQDGISVVVQDGQIADVGGAIPDLGQPKGDAVTWKDSSCAHVDAAGRWLTPGLIESLSSLGLVEVSMEGATQDSNAGGDPVRAAHDVADGFNPRSVVIPVARIEGLTTAVIHPNGGLMAGQSAAVSLAGGSQAETIGKRTVAFPFNLGGRPSLGATLGLLRELIGDARAYKLNASRYESGQSRDYAASRLDLQALEAVATGYAPLLVKADRASDIEAVVRVARELAIRVVIDGGAEAWLVAETLAAHQVPVILDPYVYGPGGFDQRHARPDNAKLLHEAGVPLLIASRSSHFARNLRQIAGNAVRGGLQHSAALAAITSGPAEAFALNDRGAISPTKRADLVLWRGDPLELSSKVDAMWIGGHPVDLESRQTKLLERYRTLPGNPLAPLPLPTP